MYQKTINKILGQEFFKISQYKGSSIKRFVSNSGKWDKTNWQKYINKEKGLQTLWQKLAAISYNSWESHDTWGVKPRSLYFYTKVNNKLKPVLSSSLCRKVIENAYTVLQGFDKNIEDMMFDKDGKQIDFKDYPNIYKAMGYIERYPISYFALSLSKKELDSLTKYLKGQVFIIDNLQFDETKSTFRLVRDINKGKYNVIDFPRTKEGMIRLTFYINQSKNISTIDKLVSKLTPKDYEILYKILS